MESVSIDKHLEQEYGISFTESELKAFNEFMRQEKVTQDNVKFTLKSKPETFLAEIMLENDVEVTAEHSKVWYDSMVYAMKPIMCPTKAHLSVLFRGKKKHNCNTYVPAESIKDMKQNLVVIKTIKYAGGEDFEVSYRFVIYNTEANVVADGIRFVD